MSRFEDFWWSMDLELVVNVETFAKAPTFGNTTSRIFFSHQQTDASRLRE
jgi:hypothetical protein